MPAPSNGVRAAFWRGLCETRLATALGIFGLALLEIALLTLLVTPDRVARLEPGIVARHPKDDGAAVTVRALRMARERSDRPAVVLTGSSSLRESVFGADALHADLAAALGLPAESFDVEDLMTSGQELFESLALLELLPPERRGVLVLGVGPGRLARSSATIRERVRHPTLAIDLDSLDARARELGVEPAGRTGLYFLDHLQFYVSRPQIPWRLLRGPIALQPHRYVAAPAWDEPKWQRGLATLREQATAPDPLTEANLAALDAALPRLSGAGRRSVLLVQGALHPRARAELVSYRADLDARLGAVAARHGSALVDLDADAALRPEDFHDFTHLRDPDAMQRYDRALAARLAPLLARCARDPSAGCTP